MSGNPHAIPEDKIRRRRCQRRIKLAKINDMTSKSRYKVFIYGEKWEQGKTYSLATFPSPLYILDCDEGVATLQGLVGDDFEYDTFTDSDPRNPTGYANLRKKVGELRKKCPYETVVLDSCHDTWRSSFQMRFEPYLKTQNHPLPSRTT